MNWAYGWKCLKNLKFFQINSYVNCKRAKLSRLQRRPMKSASCCHMSKQAWSSTENTGGQRSISPNSTPDLQYWFKIIMHIWWSWSPLTCNHSTIYISNKLQINHRYNSHGDTPVTIYIADPRYHGNGYNHEPLRAQEVSRGVHYQKTVDGPSRDNCKWYIKEHECRHVVPW